MTTDTAKADMSYTFNEAVRGVYMSIFEPKTFQKNGKSVGDPKFSLLLLIPKESGEINGLKSKMAEAAKAKWPTRAMSELKFPISTGEKVAEKAKVKGKNRDFALGHLVLSTRSKFPPTISVLENGKIITLDSDALKAKYKGKFYSGSFVAVSVNFVAYEGDMGEDGITAYIQSVLWVKDGERIGGGRDQSEVFKQYMGSTTDEDPLNDDEIPF